MKNILWYPPLTIFLVSLDWFLKHIFIENFVCNKNIAWNIPVIPGIFYFFWVIIFFFLLYYFLKSKKYSEKIALVLIISGAISNMIDRILYSCVVDFINIKIGPIFNLADVYITIGVAILIIIKILNPKR